MGVIASPTAGKDVRRLVAHAGTVGDVDKISMIRRAILGAVEAGVTKLLLLPDRKHLCERAVDRLPVDVETQILDMPVIGRGVDTVRGASFMRAAGAGAVVVFGGDGTSRDVARGWMNAPMMPMSVGTNNVFPSSIEATVGGMAAGLVATGRLSLEDVAVQAKVLHVELPEGETDIGLVDVVLTGAELIGSRAVWDVDDLRAAVFALAGPATIGLSSLGGMVSPCTMQDDHGVFQAYGQSATVVRAPIAPGSYESVGLLETRPVKVGESISLAGPGTLAFDGERDHMLTEGQEATVQIRRDGPWVIDAEQALTLAVQRDLFTTKN